jgi:hypothetical protein
MPSLVARASPNEAPKPGAGWCPETLHCKIPQTDPAGSTQGPSSTTLEALFSGICGSLCFRYLHSLKRPSYLNDSTDRCIGEAGSSLIRATSDWNFVWMSE